jgi:hypothetical protein
MAKLVLRQFPCHAASFLHDRLRQALSSPAAMLAHELPKPPPPPQMVHIKEITRTWIEERIAASPVCYDPFPHIIIEEFFPPDLYRQFLELNPFTQNKGEDWISQADASQLESKTPYWLRKQIKITGAMEEIRDIRMRIIWGIVYAVFNEEDWWFNLVRRLFPLYFAIRYGAFSKAPDFRSFFRSEHFLQRHERNYHIGPHTDVPTRVATCIFSFADRPGLDQFGTQICAPKDRFMCCSGRKHHEHENFNVVKLAPYKPNNAFLFLRTQHSFHSVAPFHEDVPNGRFGMQFQIYEQGAGIFKDSSAPGKSSEDPVFVQKIPETK